MKWLIPILLCFAPLALFGQSDLPVRGDLSDLKGKTKVYIVAEGDNVAALTKRIEKDKIFQVVAEPDKAEFFIEYKSLSHIPLTDFQAERGMVNVYIYRDKQKVIAWTADGIGSPFKDDAAVHIISKFLKTISRPPQAPRS